ncbi:MAG: hypothetical protein IPK82_43715 [Polyangiaceae bacterium]|nr:hypothetical protein [Polyangiaceae bacterium]
MNSERRALLFGALLLTVSPWIQGCGATPPPQPKVQPLPPLKSAPLAELIASASLKWALLVAPRDLYNVPWIPPLVDLAVSGARFDRFASTTGIDLRTVPEAVITASASDKDQAGDVFFYLARHKGDASLIERAFRARLSSNEKRSVDRPDLVRVSGKIGLVPNAAVLIGPDVAGFQEGGSSSRGPSRIAGLFAEGKLKSVHTLFASPHLRSLAAALGAAPLSAFAPGPFEGDLARGLRGLLGAATAVGAVVRPTERRGLAVTLAVGGDFSTSAGAAAAELTAAWNELAQSRLGHLLTLDAPLAPASVTATAEMLFLTVELSGQGVADGLSRATATKVSDIFK